MPILTQNDINKLKTCEIIRSNDKILTFIIKTFDQVKNDNFDQVKFDQPTSCQIRGEKVIGCLYVDVGTYKATKIIILLITNQKSLCWNN